MKPVRSNDEIEGAGASAFESDVNSVFRLVNMVNAVSKNRFDLTFDPGEDGGSEFSSRKAHVAALRHASKCLDRKPRYSFAIPVYNSYFLHHVTRDA